MRLTWRRVLVLCLAATVTCTEERSESFSPATDEDFLARTTGEWSSEAGSVSLCPRAQGDFCARDLCASNPRHPTPCRDVSARAPESSLRWTDDTSGCDAYGCETTPIRVGFAATLTVEQPGCRVSYPVHVSSGPSQSRSVNIEDLPAKGETSYEAGPFFLFSLDDEGLQFLYAPSPSDRDKATGDDSETCAMTRDGVLRLLPAFGDAPLLRGRPATEACPTP
jgi:hypothetical protein